jgi:hypothetical protein
MWYRHVKRMTDSRKPEQVLKWIAVCRRKKGKPNVRCGRNPLCSGSERIVRRTVDG